MSAQKSRNNFSCVEVACCPGFDPSISIPIAALDLPSYIARNDTSRSESSEPDKSWVVVIRLTKPINSDSSSTLFRLLSESTINFLHVFNSFSESCVALEFTAGDRLGLEAGPSSTSNSYLVIAANVWLHIWINLSSSSLDGVRPGRNPLRLMASS